MSYRYLLGVGSLRASTLPLANLLEHMVARDEVNAQRKEYLRECRLATRRVRLSSYGLMALLLPVATYASHDDATYPAKAASAEPQRVNPNMVNPIFGNVTTIVGLDPTKAYGDGGPAAKAILSHPTALTIDAAGNMYIADSSNNRIRKVNLPADEPTITTIVGTGAPACIEGPPADAALNQPLGVALDNATGALVIADYDNQRIRRLDGVSAPSMLLTTIAGHGNNNFECYEVLPARPTTPVCQNHPGGQPLGDQPQFCPSWGTGKVPYAQSVGHSPATACGLFFPNSVAVGSGGRVWVADTDQHRLRLLTEQPSGTYEIATVAGGGPLPLVPKGIVVNSRCVELHNPAGVVEGLNGTLYATDTLRHLVLELFGANVARRAGIGQDGFLELPLPALSAKLNQPSGLAFEPPKGGSATLGNLYIADTANHRIHKLDLTAGELTTVAGPAEPKDPYNDNGYPGGLGRPTADFAGDDAGPNTATTVGRLFAPRGVALWKDDLYIADTLNNRIRRLSLVTNELSTVVGGGATNRVFDEGGPARLGRLYFPAGIAVQGCDLFVLDHAHNRVVKVDRSKDEVTTYAGTGQSGHSGDVQLATADNLATLGRIGGPRAGIVLASDGALYFNDATQYIRKVYRDIQGAVRMTTVAGCAPWERSSVERKKTCINPAFVDGDVEADRAQLDRLEGIALDKEEQNLYIADANHQRIWRVNLETKALSTWSGRPEQCTPPKDANDLGSCEACKMADGKDCGDGGPFQDAQFNTPTSLSWYDDGLYVADQGNHVVRKVSSPSSVGRIERVAGRPDKSGDDGDGGLAAEATLFHPSALAVDPDGNLFIYTHNRIRMVDAKGYISAVAGTGETGFAGDGGPASLAEFDGEGNLAVDGDGSLLLTDTENNVVRRIERKPAIAGAHVCN